MKGPARLKSAYNARMLSSLIDPPLSARIASQVDNFNAHVNEFTPNRVALRAILSEEGVPIIQIAAFEAFHGKVYHLTKVLSGTALQTAFVNLVYLWATTPLLGGASSGILTRIGVDIYHLGAPVAP